MSLGQIIETAYETRIKIVEGIIAANGAPSAAPLAARPSGLATPGSIGIRFSALRSGLYAPRDLSVLILNTAGTGAVAATARLWNWFDTVQGGASGVWAPTGTGTAAAKGILNAGAAIDSAATVLRHHENLGDRSRGDGIYVELSAFAGTNPAFDVWLVMPTLGGGL